MAAVGDDVQVAAQEGDDPESAVEPSDDETDDDNDDLNADGNETADQQEDAEGTDSELAKADVYGGIDEDDGVEVDATNVDEEPTQYEEAAAYGEAQNEPEATEQAKEIESGSTIRCNWPNGMWYRLSPELSQKTDKTVKFEEAVFVEERQGRWVRAKDGWLQLFHPKTDELLYSVVTKTTAPKAALAAALASARASAAKAAAAADAEIKRKADALGISSGGAAAPASGVPLVKKRSKGSLKKGVDRSSLEDEIPLPAKKKKVDKSRNGVVVAVTSEPPPSVSPEASPSLSPEKEQVGKVENCTNMAPNGDYVASPWRPFPPKRRHTHGPSTTCAKAGPDDCDSQGRAPIPRPRELRSQVAKVIAQERIGEVLETLEDMGTASEADLVEVLIDIEAAMERGRHLIQSMSSQRRNGEMLMDSKPPPAALPRRPKGTAKASRLDNLDHVDSSDDDTIEEPPEIEEEFKNGSRVQGTTAKASSAAVFTPATPPPHRRGVVSLMAADNSTEDDGIARRGSAASGDIGKAIPRSRATSLAISDVGSHLAMRPPPLRRGSRMVPRPSTVAMTGARAPLPVQAPPPRGSRSPVPLGRQRKRVALASPEPVRGSIGGGASGSRAQRVDNGSPPTGKPVILRRGDGGCGAERSRSPIRPTSVLRRRRQDHSMSPLQMDAPRASGPSSGPQGVRPDPRINERGAVDRRLHERGAVELRAPDPRISERGAADHALLGSSRSGPTEREEEKIQQLGRERQQARRHRDFDKADRIRDELRHMGVDVDETRVAYAGTLPRTRMPLERKMEDVALADRVNALVSQLPTAKAKSRGTVRRSPSPPPPQEVLTLRGRAEVSMRRRQVDDPRW